jgi:hypothetical protein
MFVYRSEPSLCNVTQTHVILCNSSVAEFAVHQADNVPHQAWHKTLRTLRHHSVCTPLLGMPM